MRNKYGKSKGGKQNGKNGGKDGKGSKGDKSSKNKNGENCLVCGCPDHYARECRRRCQKRTEVVEVSPTKSLALTDGSPEKARTIGAVMQREMYDQDWILDVMEEDSSSSTDPDMPGLLDPTEALVANRDLRAAMESSGEDTHDDGKPLESLEITPTLEGQFEEIAMEDVAAVSKKAKLLLVDSGAAHTVFKRGE